MLEIGSFHLLKPKTTDTCGPQGVNYHGNLSSNVYYYYTKGERNDTDEYAYKCLMATLSHKSFTARLPQAYSSASLLALFE